MTSRTGRRLSLLGALALLLVARAAHAYPQWQFSSGTSRCNQCHYAPAGGGLITGYGRDASGEDLSTWTGDGAFLHGAVELPKSVALGFDGRYALLQQDVGEAWGGKFFYFPMQADAYARFAFTDSVSFYASVGVRGQARVTDEPVGDDAAKPIGGSGYVARVMSREHYVMWRPAALGPYVRVGRFYAPYGLRMAEHYLYIRRDTGFNLLQETYNVSGGVVKNEWELHLTAFAPDVWRAYGPEERGGVGMFERRLGDSSALGLDARVAMGTDSYTYQGGFFGKTYIEKVKTLIQAQADVLHMTFTNNVAPTNGIVGYLGLTLFPGRGFWVTPFGEWRQTDLKVKGSATTAGGVQLNWFPYPHFEVVFLGRYQDPSGPQTARTALFFVHYYL
jgi:hypothetical protein